MTPRHRLIEAATARPWVVRRWKKTPHGHVHIWIASYQKIIGINAFGVQVPQDILCDEDYPEKEADAELIVTAVNAHEKLIAARNMLDDLIPLMDSWMGYLPPEGEQAFKEWRADAWQVAQMAKGRHSEDFDGDYTTLASIKVKP
jgi:hypothetical protein